MSSCLTMKESDLQALILASYKNHPRVFMERRNTGRFGDKRQYQTGHIGAADIECVIAPLGRKFCIEVKSDYWRIDKRGRRVHVYGTQNDNQIMYENSMVAHGAVYITAYDLATVQAAMKEEMAWQDACVSVLETNGVYIKKAPPERGKYGN